MAKPRRSPHADGPSVEDFGRAVPVVARMRAAFTNPAITAEALLLKMEAEGLVETVDALTPHAESL